MISPRTFSDFAAQLRECIAQHSAPSPTLPSSNLESRFNQLALSLFALQFAQNQPFRRFCESRRATPETVEHWTQIPAIPAVAFKEFELTSLPVESRTRVFHSSGTTTQRPGRHFHDAESLSLYEASLLPWFQTHLLPEIPLAALHSSLPREPLTSASVSLAPRCASGERVGERGFQNFGSGASPEEPPHSALRTPHLIRFLSLTPPSALAPHSSLVHMFATLHREFGASDSNFTGLLDADGAWTVDLAQSIAVLRDAITSGVPIVVMGTAFNFVQLADHLEEAGLRLPLPAGSRILETGGYKGRSRSLPKPALHALLARLFDVSPSRIVSEYGMSELSSQAYDVKFELSNATPEASERTFHFPPWARAQIVSPETGREVAAGETGLIRIFDLANLHSVLAVQTEDLGIRRGDGFELLGRAAMAEARGCSLMSA